MSRDVPGPYIVAGQLFFRLLDGSTVSCECIAEVYAEKIVEAHHAAIAQAAAKAVS